MKKAMTKKLAHIFSISTDERRGVGRRGGHRGGKNSILRVSNSKTDFLPFDKKIVRPNFCIFIKKKT